jgi:N-sulfoglucosamine sulfohydrolase
MQHLEYADQLATWKELRRLCFEEANQLARGEQPDRLTPAQRRVVATTKPQEELYDVHADPYEIHNLAGDPRYTADLERLREALGQWQHTYSDLGLIPEAELIERWRPGGVWSVTEPPAIQIADGRLIATCATAGASIAWTTDPPRPHIAPSVLSSITGDPDTGGRAWQLYSAPFSAPAGTAMWFRAHRLGFRASADVVVTLAA